LHALACGTRALEAAAERQVQVDALHQPLGLHAQPRDASRAGRVTARTMRRKFFAGLLSGLRMVWPVVSGLLVWMAALGAAVGLLEGWKLADSLYFAFVTGLTIGYGDLVPKLLASRVLAIVIGISGIVLTGLIAAIAVRALLVAAGRDGGP